MPEIKAEEIIKALRCSGSPGGPESCDGCDTDKIALDAADLLEKLMADKERLGVNHE